MASTSLITFLAGSTHGKPVIKTVKVDKSDVPTIIQTPDNMIITVGGYNKVCGDENPNTFNCFITVDINGEGGPTFSAVTNGEKSASGVALSKLEIGTKGPALGSEVKSRRDIVIFAVNDMNIIPYQEDAVTCRYFSGTK